jgi:hypothetical protein
MKLSRAAALRQGYPNIRYAFKSRYLPQIGGSLFALAGYWEKPQLISNEFPPMVSNQLGSNSRLPAPN